MAPPLAPIVPPPNAPANSNGGVVVPPPNTQVAGGITYAPGAPAATPIVAVASNAGGVTGTATSAGYLQVTGAADKNAKNAIGSLGALAMGLFALL